MAPRLWPFRRKPAEPQAATSTALPTAGSLIITKLHAFDGDLEDFVVLRRHAVRALCGMFMDRHSGCAGMGHPFCGPGGHRQNGDTPYRLIAQAIPQRDALGGGDLIGIYLCLATNPADGHEQQDIDIMEHIAQMTFAHPTPGRKLVVNPPENGVYHIRYGPVINPVEGDFSTGQIDPDSQILLRSDPEPAHCRWQYWESSLTEGNSLLVPTFHCLQVLGECWVVDVDRSRGMAQQVAALEFADNPEHDFGG